MKTKSATTCYHCGDACSEEQILLHDHSFCCQGCKTVYQLLEETGLCTYYDIEQKPGAKNAKGQQNLDFLDHDQVVNKLVSYRQGSQNRVTFYIPAMHCAACIWLLEKLQRFNPGVEHSETNFLKKELTVLFDSERISLRELVALLSELGYPPDLDRKQGEAKQKSNHDLLLKLGVAGFAFGNIMLFSFPEYLSMDTSSMGVFEKVFGYLNLLLALPVLIYSDRDYLVGAWRSIKLQHLTIDVPIALGIITLFVRSTIEILLDLGPGYFDSFAGLVFFLLIGKWYQSKTYSALAFDRDFKSYFPIAVSKVSDGKESPCMLEDIKIGDELKILNQQIIPADSVLISEGAQLDYSFVNGESDSVAKQRGELLYAGGRVLSGAVHVKVAKSISQSYLTSLWNQNMDADPKKYTGLSELVDKASKWFSIAILSLALITLVAWLFIDPPQALNAFTAVLIIACPCALALAMPFTSGSVSRILGKHGFFVRNASTHEQLSKAKAFVFDKTGTLTMPRMKQVVFSGPQPTDEIMQAIVSVAANSTHPLSQALVQVYDYPHLRVTQFEEFPGSGVKAVVGQRSIRLGSRAFARAKSPSQSSTSEVHLNVDGVYLGCFEFTPAYRKGIKDLIRKLRQLGKVHLLSGDNDNERQSIESIFGSDASIHFNQSPQSKREYVQNLETAGTRCLMFGDGLNDAGALKAASVGISVADNVYSFSPACDVIVKASELSHMVDYLRFVNFSMTVVKWSILLSLFYNVIGLTFAVQGLLTPLIAAILMPLSSLSVVLFVSMMTVWRGRNLPSGDHA